MLLLLATITGILVLVFLMSARSSLKGLPRSDGRAPDYVLWLRDRDDIPPLEPAPSEIVRGELPPETDRFILMLSGDTVVSPKLPNRLAACGSDFVSVMPVPQGNVLQVSGERVLRDLVNPARVNDVRDAAAYADDACLWFSGRLLSLPGTPGPVALRLARARKLHGLPIDLREGRDGESGDVLLSTTRPLGDGSRLLDVLAVEPVARWLVAGFFLLCNLIPWIGLAFDSCRSLSLVAIALMFFTRLFTALREGFGWSLLVTGWVFEPWWAYTLIRGRSEEPNTRMPELPETLPPQLTGSDARGQSVLDASAVLFLARRLGGSGVVMEQLYSCIPSGRNRLGRQIDRWVHWAPATRAVRWRWLVAGELLRKLAPANVLSVPCGTARDVSWGRVESSCVVDPDPAVRARAEARLPAARVLDGSVDDLPAERFECVVYIGLSEYLGDGEVRRHLELLRNRLAPGGALITSMTAEHEQRTFMSHQLGWSTRPRTKDGVCRLLEASGFWVELIEHDPHQIQWVFLARKRSGFAESWGDHRNSILAE